jgi:endo-1,4-beta-mannosidase
MSEPFTLGVNYWPRRKAMYWWSDFDPGEVRDEFATIRDLGLSVVRIFLLWDDFQPTPDSISSSCLANLTKVCDIAVENGLKLDITFFTGHMSGPNWAPGWLLGNGLPSPYIKRIKQVVQGERIVNSGYRNPFTDPVALGAQRLQLQTIAGRLKDHPAIWLWNLGNEPDLFAWPPDADTGEAWVREMSHIIHEVDDQHAVTCGLHMASLEYNNRLRVDQVFAETDVAVMHGYPMYVDWLHSPLDPDFVPFLCGLTQALCGKPVLMEEFGGCTAQPGEESHRMEWIAYGELRDQFMASEQDLAVYMEAVLPRLVEVGATGALIWCYADYHPDLWDRPPCAESQHERFFGLVRPDGSLKPHAEVIKQFAATNPIVRAEPRQCIHLDLSPDTYYQNPEEHIRLLYEEFVASLRRL